MYSAETHPIFHAVIGGKTAEVAKFLAEGHADKIDDYGNTPFVVAVGSLHMRGLPDMVDIFLAAKVSPLQEGRNGLYPYHLAARALRYPNIVEKFDRFLEANGLQKPVYT